MTIYFGDSNSSTQQAAGKIKQLKSTPKLNTWSTSANSSWQDITGLSVTIDLTSSSNQVYITGFVTISQSTYTAYRMALRIVRGSTAIALADADGDRERCTVGTQGMAHADSSPTFSFAYLDSPGADGNITYKMQMIGEHSIVYVNRSGSEGDGNAAITPRMISVITAMEVSA